MKLSTTDLAGLIPAIVELAIAAGKATLPYWHHTEALEVIQKSDDSPLTQADLASHQTIVTGLTQLTPSIPIISEESEAMLDYAQRRDWAYHWLLDPLDGTRGFIRHCSEYSVNIALIHQQVPILGVIYAPVADDCYFAWQAGGAFKQGAFGDESRLQVVAPQNPLRVIIGQSHCSRRLQAFLEAQPFAYELLRLNSSLKFAWLAEGRADVYPRLGPTSEWDTAAGQCILSEAGGVTVDFNQQILQYNAKPSLLNPEFLAITAAPLVEMWSSLAAKNI